MIGRWAAWYNPGMERGEKNEKKKQKNEFSLCAAAHHMPGIRGPELGEGGGVTESVKDSRPASFLKTLPPQSGLLLCIMSIRVGGRGVRFNGSSLEAMCFSHYGDMFHFNPSFFYNYIILCSMS